VRISVSTQASQGWIGTTSSLAGERLKTLLPRRVMATGCSAGRTARVGGKRLFIIASMAAGPGLVMILLKEVVLIHLH
jgi:hypothetical protein